MNIEKKIIGHLNKCYSIAPLHYQEHDFFLVAAEKQDPCYLYDLEGNQISKIWDGSGGVMSMVQIPETNGEFLATFQFYSPNDSKEAKIVRVIPKKTEAGQHRFWQSFPMCTVLIFSNAMAHIFSLPAP